MKKLQYRDKTYRVREVPIKYGSHPYPEPGDPLYILIDDRDEKPSFTLWWVHGLPDSEHGRVMNIEEYTTEYPYPTGTMLRSELFVETTDGFQYVDNRHVHVN